MNLNLQKKDVVRRIIIIKKDGKDEFHLPKGETMITRERKERERERERERKRENPIILQLYF